MNHIPQGRAEEFRSSNVTSWEYTTESESMNVARIKIEGRYPEGGFTANYESDSIIHVIGGTGVIRTRDGACVELTSHDQIHLRLGDAYSFEGSLEIIYSATPKWNPQQAKHID